jgi:small subunit ribosomal protein S17
MKILTGKVISSKTQNTLIVEVEKNRIHPLYKKIIHRSKKYKVHYEGKGANVGETVSIVEIRPMSKDKHFRLSENKENKVTKK